MKFSNSLKFNAVADWWDEYIAYSALKKQIYQLEKKQLALSSQREYDLESNERTALMDEDHSSGTDNIFKPLLDRELKKICDFYELQERELLQQLEELEGLVRMKDEESFINTDPRLAVGDDDEEEDDDDDRRESSLNRERPRKRAASGRRRVKSDAKMYPSSLQSSSMSPAMARRHSVSSSEDGLDLEASVASLGLIPEDDALLTGSHDPRGSSSSPRRTKTSLSNIFNIAKPGGSISSLQVPETIWTAKTNYAYDTRILFKRRIASLYSTLTSLRAYVELNLAGFRKILKKYDKVTYSELQERYMHNFVEEAYPFQQERRDRLKAAIERLTNLYAKCITRDDRQAAVRQLKVHQREHIAWERDTVWRQMINQERRGERVGQLGSHTERGEDAVLAVPTPMGRFKLTPKKISLIIAIITFVTLLNVQTVPGVEANNCFAILVFSTILWATEAIPLFVTSILIPLLLVTFRVFISLPDDNCLEGSDCTKVTRLTPQDATKYVFSQMFSPTIMLLIGGFTISSALSKTNIDRVLITRILSLAGTRPNVVLLSFMGVSCFASMWISNVAAPTLCFTLIKPILRNLPPRAPFAPCLILGIALAANIGGQASPISSPQNLIALQAMDVALDWSQWLIVAIPVCGISIFLIWLLLMVSYRPTKAVDGEDLIIKEIRPTKERFTLKQYWVIFVCSVTILLWLIEKKIEKFVGDMGIIAIIPIVAFFSTGVLRKDDFDQFLWTIVFLAMGGIALGKGVSSSGLLDILGELIKDLIDGLSIQIVVPVLSIIVLVISTFISHTIASVLLVPIAKEVGNNLKGDHQRLLIFLTGLLCSTGMGMPVSGFPNQTAATQEDDMGQLYLSNIDFLKNGVPASIIAALVVATVGYLLMLAIGL